MLTGMGVSTFKLDNIELLIKCRQLIKLAGSRGYQLIGGPVHGVLVDVYRDGRLHFQAWKHIEILIKWRQLIKLALLLESAFVLTMITLDLIKQIYLFDIALVMTNT